jgi:inner membrane protein
VDNLTHTLVGWSLAKAGLEKRTQLAVPALLIGANLPDVEIVRGLFGGSYLTLHRGVSHTPVGVVGLSLGLAGALWLYGRFKHTETPGPPAFFPLWYVSLLGLLTHPLLDYLNDYGIRPWLPFSSTRYYGDLLTLLDPWVWVMLGCSLFLLTPSLRGRLGWLTLGLLLATVVSLGWSPLTGLLWVVTAGLAIGLGHLLHDRGFNPARIALLAFVLYASGVATARDNVVKSARAFGPGLVGGRVEKIDVLPGRPGSFRRWTVVMQTADRYYFADVGLQDWRRHPPQFEVFAKNLNDPYYRKSLAESTMAALADFARFPSVTVESTAGGHAVLLRDLRYARYRATGWAVARAVVPDLHP